MAVSSDVLGTPCPRHIIVYHLVCKHLQATWPKPEQSHLLSEACSPNGTDNRRQCQRRMKCLAPEPGEIPKRIYALYDDKRRHYKKKVFELYCLVNRLMVNVCKQEHLISAQISKNLTVNGLYSVHRDRFFIVSML